MQFDIDFLKNTIAQDDKPGSVARLSALKRAINVVEPAEVLLRISFKANMKYLGKISRRSKSSRFYQYCIKLSQSKLFSTYFITTVILANTAILAVDRYPQDSR